MIQGLYAITAADAATSATQLTTQVEQAILGGARIIQYRCKIRDHHQRRQQAQLLSTLCQHYAIPLIINDDIKLARQVAAAGVHLGHDDAPLAEARRQLGDDAIIGISCYNQLDLACQAQAGGASYVAFGSFYASPTKPQAVTATTELLHQAAGRLSIPLVAIGGITPSNGAALISAGATALAVISGVFTQPDIAAAARRYAVLFSRQPAD